jgi:NAD/NADP transhydrogenase beta subunit
VFAVCFIAGLLYAVFGKHLTAVDGILIHAFGFAIAITFGLWLRWNRRLWFVGILAILLIILVVSMVTGFLNNTINFKKAIPVLIVIALLVFSMTRRLRE